MGYIRYENTVNIFNPELIKKFKEAKMTFDNIKNKKDDKIIVNISIDDIADFPIQAEIYGEARIENEFIASVADSGIITPIIVCKTEELDYVGCVGLVKSKTYTLISGHRRKRAGEILNFKTMPAIVKSYRNYDDAELDFLICNMQREKTNKVRLGEFRQYKNVLSKIIQVRKKSNAYENTIYENKAFSRIWKQFNLDAKFVDDSPIDSIEILKEITGYSKYEQEFLNVLYGDEWLQKKLDRLRSLGCPAENEEAILASRDIIIAEYENETNSLNHAVNEVKKLFLNAETELSKSKVKKEKKPLPKIEAVAKPEPIPLIGRINIPVNYSEMPMRYDENNSKCEFYFKAEGLGLGLIYTQNVPVGICVDTPEGIGAINLGELAKIIKESM